MYAAPAAFAAWAEAAALPSPLNGDMPFSGELDWYPHRRMSGLLLDLRLALRGLSRRRVATLAAIVSLALGFAAQIAVLSCTNAVLWRALPVPRPDRAVNVYGYSKLIGGTTNIAYPPLEQLKGLDVFDAVAAFT